MKVSRTFLLDFAYLANYYQWGSSDIEDVKAHIRDNPDMVRYWSILAAAHRNGYEQSVENNFVRLQPWCTQHGFLGPYVMDV